MEDTYGDGWNSASIDIYINGSYSNYWSLNNGFFGTDSETTNNADIISFSFNSESQ